MEILTPVIDSSSPLNQNEEKGREFTTRAQTAIQHLTATPPSTGIIRFVSNDLDDRAGDWRKFVTELFARF